MRFQVLKFFFILIFVMIILRLFYWQVLRSDDLTALAEKQHVYNSSIEAPRGNVYSQDGAILASDKPVFTLFGQPKLIKDKDSVSEKVAKILAAAHPEPRNPNLFLLLRKEIKETLSQDLFWVPLQKNVDWNTKSEIEKLNLTGVGFDNQLSRLYPEASSAAHVLGFVGSDSLGRQTGYFGIEGYYNGELKGRAGSLIEEKDAYGLPILTGKFVKSDAKKGYDLILNIDRTVQYLVEKKLKEGVEKYGAKTGSVVVLDPQTGAVLAMASFPNYDPNNFNSFPKEYFKNPIVADTYEPGSTFKVLVMAAAINEGLVKPDTKCDMCSGPVLVSGNYIRTWNNKYYPDTTMADVIIHSDNTGMVFTGRKLGQDRMYKYIQEFGFGKHTQIDLQDEVSSDIRPINEWREIDLATSSFGQGIAVTAIQMVTAVASIANGGKVMEPHVVSSIKASDRYINIQPKVFSQPLSEETAKIVTQMMVDAVEKGEAKFVSIPGYKIAGKTGTAQIPVAGHYDQTKTIASFVGFAPADKPKFVMLVRYQEPSASIFGAETAAPTFFAIAKELFTYWGIPPSN